ncbi:MAG: hypothetical protein ACYSTT_04870 [Planctomycetota bacterium]
MSRKEIKDETIFSPSILVHNDRRNSSGVSRRSCEVGQFVTERPDCSRPDWD